MTRKKVTAYEFASSLQFANQILENLGNKKAAQIIKKLEDDLYRANVDPNIIFYEFDVENANECYLANIELHKKVNATLR